METDYMLFVLQFIHNCYAAAFLMAAKIGPISAFLAPVILVAVGHVLHKIFVCWPDDFRCWRSGGIGTSSLNTDAMNRLSKIHRESNQ